MLAQPVAALDVEELEQEAAGVVRRDEGAAALAAHDDVLGAELVDGLAQACRSRRRRRGRARLRSAARRPARSAGLDRAEERALDHAVERHAGASGAIGAKAVGGAAAHGRILWRAIGDMQVIYMT